MSVSYKRLWKLLIDRDMKKTQLRDAAGVSSSTFAKLNRNEYVALEILVRLCVVLKCELSDIVEVVFDNDVKATSSDYANRNVGE